MVSGIYKGGCLLEDSLGFPVFFLEILKTKSLKFLFLFLLTNNVEKKHILVLILTPHLASNRHRDSLWYGTTCDARGGPGNNFGQT
jgi:hypothetical protein